MLIDTAMFVGACYLTYELVNKLDPGELISSKFKNIDNHCLTIGYKRKLGLKVPIVIDMKKTCHCLIVGLSGSGKSKMVEAALKGKDCILLNAFPEDMTTLKCRRIFTEERIFKYLSNLLENKQYYENGLYICIDEGLVLCNTSKRVCKLLQDILSIGRHYGWYLILLSQAGTKNDIPFKNLFNCRVCLKNVDPSSYSVVLGAPVDVKLQPREFVVYHTDIEYGRTYDV